MRSNQIASCMLALALASLCHAAPAQQGSASRAAWIGVWHAELDGQPSATLTLADDAGSLGGTLFLNAVSREGGGPHVVFTETHMLLTPRFNGKELSFQVKGRGRSMNFTVDLQTGGNAAEIHCTNCGSDAPVVALKRGF